MRGSKITRQFAPIGIGRTPTNPISTSNLGEEDDDENGSSRSSVSVSIELETI
jgi:hypothetical protein